MLLKRSDVLVIEQYRAVDADQLFFDDFEQFVRVDQDLLERRIEAAGKVALELFAHETLEAGMKWLAFDSKWPPTWSGDTYHDSVIGVGQFIGFHAAKFAQEDPAFEAIVLADVFRVRYALVLSRA